MPTNTRTKDAAERPNIIVILTDDQGYGDLSCMGQSDFATPSLDKLADSGARFTSWYSNSAVCSPARSSIMSGRYPGNAGVRSIIRGHRRATGLPQDVPTIAEALKKHGYRTGLFGKWHLGSAAGSRPEQKGFEETFGFLAGCVDYYSHIMYNDLEHGMDPVHDLWQNGNELYENGRYLTDSITDRAVRFIRTHSSQKEPFFAFVSYNAPHYPMHAPEAYMDRFSHLPWDRRVMAAMLSVMDDGVGEITAELERQGVRDNTFIVFQSDNGPSRETRNWLDGTPDPYYGGTAGSLKGHKFSLYEGGIRVPAIMSWPDNIPAGQIISEVGVGMDLFPTILDALGISTDGYEFDGLSVMKMITAGESTPHEALYWELMGQTAVRMGKWKLVVSGQLVEYEEPPVRLHLANLDDDMGERENLAEAYPELTEELHNMASRWRAGIEHSWEARWGVGASGVS